MGEPEPSNTCAEMTVDGEKSVETLPDKSRSLRRTSVQKRLETEIKRSQPKLKEKISKKYRLSKYRRKTENAKERERMKKFNEAFTTLRKILPNKDTRDTTDTTEATDTTTATEAEKDTKVNIIIN